MIGWFIFIAALMTALAAALTLPAFLRPRRKSGADPDDNIAAARERLADLKARAAAGEVNPADAAELEVEIKSQLLQEAEESKPPPRPPLKPDRIGALATAAALLIAAPLLYWQIGEHRALAPPQPRDIVAGLEARAAAGDLDALLWLARFAAAHEQFAVAADYYRRARAVGGDAPELLAAHLTALLEDPQADDREIEATLQQALALAPENPLILWLAGVRADGQGDLQTAISYWRQARDRWSDQPQRQQTIAAIIAAAEAKTNAQPAAETTETPTAQTAQTTTTADAAATADAANAGVVVEVRLGEGVSVAPQTPLFVFAKAAGGGGGPPLAVRRHTAAALAGGGLTVLLDDAAAMAPAFTMSRFAAYDITARLSADAAAAPGDWFGAAAAAAGATVTIVINRQIP